MGPKAGLDDIEKWKFCILPGLELKLPSRPTRSQLFYKEQQEFNNNNNNNNNR
jgi:hypothetical protein